MIKEPRQENFFAALNSENFSLEKLEDEAELLKDKRTNERLLKDIYIPDDIDTYSVQIQTLHIMEKKKNLLFQ